MKIKVKPVEPQKSDFHNSIDQVYRETMYLYDTKTSDFIKKLQDLEIKYPNCLIEFNVDYTGCYYESDKPSVELAISKETFPSEKYATAIANYKKELKKWEDWYKQNKDQVDAELEKRKLYEEELKKLNERFK